MTFCICKRLLSQSLKNPPRLSRPNSPFSISPTLFSTSSRPAKSNQVVPMADFLINRHNFSPESASKVASTVTQLRKPDISDSVLFYLKSSGFSQTHLEEIIKRVPRLLSCNIDTSIKPKIDFFKDFGLPPSDIAEIIASDPWVLRRSLDKLSPSLLMLESVLGSKDGVSRILKISGWFLKHDLEKTLMPNIEFLKSRGISTTQIRLYLYSFPRFFLLKPESMMEFSKRLDELGFDRRSKMLMCAMRVLSSMSMETWKLKLQLFEDLGYAEGDILCVFRRLPQVFAVSERKIKEVIHFLQSNGFRFSFVSHPEILLCSLEKRLKPRLQVLENLDRKKLLLMNPGSLVAFKVSHEKFCARYVLPYSDQLEEPQIANKWVLL